MRLIVASALLLAAGGAVAADRPSPLERDAARAEKTLAGRTARAPVSCVQLRNLEGTTRINDRAVLFGNRSDRVVYRNDLPQSCPRLGAPGTAYKFRSTQTQICDIDTVELFDTTSGISYGSCQLGRFTPYERGKAG